MAYAIGPIQSIPNEVLSIIFANLGPNDLKATRLVCQLWSILAITNLFKSIYISPRPKDLQVFRHISSHDRLRNAVRKLVYDASTMREIAASSKLDYCNELIWQIGQCGEDADYFDLRRLEAFQASTLTRSDLHGNPFLKPCRILTKEQREELVLKDEIIQGYNACQKLLRLEQKIVTSGMLEELLVRGLRNLFNLEEVAIRGHLCEQSPFSRSWPLIYLFPKTEGIAHNHEYETETEDYDKMHHHCHNILVRALSTSGRQIKKLAVGESKGCLLPIDFFHTDCWFYPGTSTVSSMLYTYSGLKTLSLSINSVTEIGYYEYTKWMSLQMPNLTSLSLSGQGHPRDRRSLDDLRITIPFELFESWSCPHLHCLSLSDITATEEQLIGILKKYSLRYFEIGTVQLKGGSWVSTLDSIRHYIPKPQRIVQSGSLEQFDELPSWRRHPEDVWMGLPKRIESYLNIGGINPLLEYPLYSQCCISS